MQQTLEAVRRAAQAEIAEARRDRDAWREKCEGQGAGSGREAALVAALEAESERLAAARDEVASLTAQNSLEVADLKAKLGHVVRSAQKRQDEQDAENRRLRGELESVRAGGETSARATAATVEGLQGRILGIEGRAKELEKQHEREVADLKSVNKVVNPFRSPSGNAVWGICRTGSPPLCSQCCVCLNVGYSSSSVLFSLVLSSVYTRRWRKSSDTAGSYVWPCQSKTTRLCRPSVGWSGSCHLLSLNATWFVPASECLILASF